MNRKPAIRPVELGILKEPQKILLDNNIPVYFFNTGPEGLIEIDLTFRAGSVYESTHMTASSVNEMLQEGCKGLSALKLNRLLDYYGATYSPYCDKDTAGVIVSCLTRHFEVIMEIIFRVLFDPLFPERELKSLNKKRIRQLLVSKEKVQVLSAMQFFESVFGPDHPYGRKTEESDFQNINPVILKKFHCLFYIPENMSIIASGGIPDEFGSILNRVFGVVPTGNNLPGKPKKLSAGRRQKSTHIEKTGSVQSSLCIGSATCNKCDPEYHTLDILTFILGGYFGSRLMKNLREDKGYTYGINAFVTSFDLSGFKLITGEVSNKFTQFAVDEIYREIRKLQTTTIEKDELEMVRNLMLGNMVRMFDGPVNLAASFESVYMFGLDYSYYYTRVEKIKTITPDELREAAIRYYNIDELFQVTAG